MTPNTPRTGDPRFDELVAGFLLALDRGEEPDRSALLAAAPDLADRLKAFFADHDRLGRAVGGSDPFNPPTDAYAGPAPAAGTMVKYVGDYELLDELARGGMGVVYRAKQQSLGRVVALKMILSGGLAKPEERYRFKQEAEAAASLDHPNIVPIHEVGEHEGQPYFSMKLIEGPPLQRWLKDKPPRRQIVELLAQVADAIDHAHRRGILHRDLKPGNILIGERRGVSPPCPHVTDFGLAKRMTAGEDLTQSGDKLGTPAYMAPEQLKNARGVTTAVDVWALGVVLYESLAGKKPFAAEDPITLFRQIAEQEPTAPRVLTPDLDRDLETIILKCLEKEPAKRLASAGEVAAELRRWLRGEPIQARPVGQFEKAWRWCRRNPALSGLTAAVAASLLLATGLSLGLANWALGEKDRADANAKLVLDANYEAGVQLGRAEVAVDKAETNLARSFLRPFQVGRWDGFGEAGQELEHPVLWELAENRGERLWFLTIEEALKEPRTTRQLVNNADKLLHAAVGLDPARRRKLADHFLARLRDPEGKDRHNDIAFLLVSLGGLTDQEASEVAQPLLATFERKLREGNGAVEALADALGALADQMDAAQANRAGTLLATALERMDQAALHGSAVLSGWDLPEQGSSELALRQLAPRLAPELASQLATTLSKSISKLTNEHARPSTLLALADRLSPAAAAAIRQQAAAMKKEIPVIYADNPSDASAAADSDPETLNDERLRVWLVRSSPVVVCERLGAGFSSLGALGGLTPAALGVNLARAAEPFPARFSDAFMVELLHRPIAVGPWRRAILDVLGTKHRRHFRDQWDYVRFAQEKKLPLDFTAGPKRKLPNGLR